MPSSLFRELKLIETILRAHEFGTGLMLSTHSLDTSCFAYVCIIRTLLAMYLHSTGTAYLFLDTRPSHSHGSGKDGLPTVLGPEDPADGEGTE